jgi:hypothetical protein
MRTQLANPVVSSIGPGLLAEARHAGALADVLCTSVAAPRRAADLLIAHLGFRMLIMDGNSDDEYLDILTAAIEAALKAAVR